LEAVAAVAWRGLVVAALVWVMSRLVSRLFLVVLPVLMALVGAVLLEPIVQALHRRKAPRSLAAFVVVFGGVLVSVGLLAFIGFRVAGQLGQLEQVLQAAQADVLTWLRQGPFGLAGIEVSRWTDEALGQLEANFGAIVSQVLRTTLTAFQLGGVVVLALILTFFFVRDSNRITGWLLARGPSRHRETVQLMGGRAAQTLRSYFRGVIIVGLADAAGVGIGLVVLGVPLVAPLALLVFLGAFFPIVGAFVSGLVAVLVTLVTTGVVKALIMLGIVILVQQVEGNVLQPVVMARTVPLHPVVVLVALGIGSLIGGIAGAALSVPLVAVASAAGNELRVRRERGEV
jgi:putative heme transporter